MFSLMLTALFKLFKNISGLLKLFIKKYLKFFKKGRGTGLGLWDHQLTQITTIRYFMTDVCVEAMWCVCGGVNPHLMRVFPLVH
mgnify:CR=1 FL=1